MSTGPTRFTSRRYAHTKPFLMFGWFGGSERKSRRAGHVTGVFRQRGDAGNADELEEFFRSISGETADFMRPNLFVNTPDILTEYLQFGGPAAFTIRATLAATAAPLWGVYTGFELFESVARPGAEEYIDNEKFEYKMRDWAAIEKEGTSLAPYLTKLNEIRAEHPALRQLRNITIQRTDDDAIERDTAAAAHADLRAHGHVGHGHFLGGTIGSTHERGLWSEF